MTAAERGLVVNRPIEPPEIENLRALDDAAKATDAAIRLLAHRARSTHELRQRLRRKNFDPDVIEAAMERLEHWHYVDDAAFAQSWVENRSTFRPRGSRLIAQELRSKGIDKETIETTLADADLDDRASALAVAQSKLRSLADADPETRRRRLAGLLARRGFAWSVVGPVLNEVLGADGGAGSTTNDLADDAESVPDT